MRLVCSARNGGEEDAEDDHEGGTEDRHAGFMAFLREDDTVVLPIKNIMVAIQTGETQ